MSILIPSRDRTVPSRTKSQVVKGFKFEGSRSPRSRSERLIQIWVLNPSPGSVSGSLSRSKSAFSVGS
uniref:Uncharacterized protein n=1 Tax=Cannabis sativa TaxID=3483 RepID=A0A803QRV2_CANSA